MVFCAPDFLLLAPREQLTAKATAVNELFASTFSSWGTVNTTWK